MAERKKLVRKKKSVVKGEVLKSMIPIVPQINKALQPNIPFVFKPNIRTNYSSTYFSQARLNRLGREQQFAKYLEATQIPVAKNEQYNSRNVP